MVRGKKRLTDESVLMERAARRGERGKRDRRNHGAGIMGAWVLGRRVAAWGTVVACTLGVAACGSSSPATSSAPASSGITASNAAAATGGSGTGRKATGSPYVVAYLEENSPVADFLTQHLAGVTAAIKYVNNELGGVNGHPLKLWVCKDASIGDASSTAACAQSAATQHPIVVLGTAVVYGIVGEPVMAAHQIPSQMVPELPQDFANPQNFPIGGNGTSEDQAQGAYAEQTFHPKTAVVLAAAGPAAATEIAQASKDLPGGHVKSVLFSLTGGSTLPSVVQAVQSHPDVLMVDVGAGPFAVQLFKEIQAQGYPSSHIVAISAAVDGPTLKQAGSAVNGTVFTFETKPWTDTSDPQVATYLKEYAKYGTSGVTGQSPAAEWGFSDVMQSWAAARKLSGTVTGPKLLAYLKSARSLPGFLSHGVGTHSPGYPGIGNPYVWPVKYENGTLAPATGKWFASPALLGKG